MKSSIYILLPNLYNSCKMSIFGEEDSKVFFKRNQHPEPEIDELAIKRWQKKDANRYNDELVGKIVTGDRLYKCSNCNGVFKKFEQIFLKVAERNIEGCPHCKKTIVECEMIPSDVYGR